MMVPAELSKPIHCSPAETEYFDIDICKTVSSREAWADYLNRKPRGKK